MLDMEYKGFSLTMLKEGTVEVKHDGLKIYEAHDLDHAKEEIDCRFIYLLETIK